MFESNIVKLLTMWEKVRCPKCGAGNYLTDAECLSCGAELARPPSPEREAGRPLAEWLCLTCGEVQRSPGPCERCGRPRLVRRVPPGEEKPGWHRRYGAARVSHVISGTLCFLFAGGFLFSLFSALTSGDFQTTGRALGLILWGCLSIGIGIRWGIRSWGLVFRGIDAWLEMDAEGCAIRPRGQVEKRLLWRDITAIRETGYGESEVEMVLETGAETLVVRSDEWRKAGEFREIVWAHVSVLPPRVSDSSAKRIRTTTHIPWWVVVAALGVVLLILWTVWQLFYT